MNLKEPLVEGMWYIRSDYSCGPAVQEGDWMSVLGDTYYDDGTAHDSKTPWLVRSIGYVVAVDPREVIAELRERSYEAQRRSSFGYGAGPSYHSGSEEAYDVAADLVAEKFGVNQ